MSDIESLNDGREGSGGSVPRLPPAPPVQEAGCPLPPRTPPGTGLTVALAHGKILPEVERFISVSNLIAILQSVELKCLNWQPLERALGSLSF